MTDRLDQHHMHRAVELARATIGLASPNPQVGCVLVHDEKILGEGAHHYDARDHAEIVALKQAAGHGHPVEGATAYVTLEPCSHHGRTGPCADALITAKIARCVVATVDPNPLVSGRGIARPASPSGSPAPRPATRSSPSATPPTPSSPASNGSRRQPSLTDRTGLPRRPSSTPIRAMLLRSKESWERRRAPCFRWQSRVVAV
jgi:pyrimidine deaminase RibD-like protein